MRCLLDHHQDCTGKRKKRSGFWLMRLLSCIVAENQIVEWLSTGRSSCRGFQKSCSAPLVSSLLALIIVNERRSMHASLCNSRFISGLFPFFCQTGFDPAAACLKGCNAVCALIRWPCWRLFLLRGFGFYFV
jgi:hypothetical protein